MRITFTAPSLEPGGVETYIFGLARALADGGHCVEILLTERQGGWHSEATGRGLRVRCLPVDHSVSRMAHVTAVAGELARSCDLCFLNHDRVTQAGLGLLPDRVIAVPIIHNDSEGVYRVGCANGDAWNVLVAVSPKVARICGDRVRPRPVLTILYGVQDGPPKPGRSGPGWQLLFSGRLLHKHKGVLFLPAILESCLKRNLDCRLTVAGDGPDRSALEQEFQKRGLGARVEMLGWVQPDAVRERMAAAHILLLPSLFEGFALTLLEAMAAGCVPIASRLPGITDQSIVPGQTGMLVETGDIEGFAEAIEGLCRKPDCLEAMSRSARERYQRHFSLERMRSDYAQLVQDAAAGAYPLPRARAGHVDRSLLEWRDFVPTGLKRVWRTMVRDRTKELRSAELRQAP